MTKIKLCAIAAASENNVIGKDNKIPWHISEDFKYFKATTMGKPMIMGRKSFESLPGVLPGRPHIVISRAKQTHENGNVHFVTSIKDAIDLGNKIATKTGQDKAFIVGGAEIYKQTLDQIDRLYLTRIHKTYEGDAFFPIIDEKNWATISKNPQEGDPAYTFLILEPKKA